MERFTWISWIRRLGVVLPVLILAVLLWPGNSQYRQLASAQVASQSPAAVKEAPIDEYDRTAQVWYYQRMGKSGWERGQEIYYMKCWICHNDYTRKASPASAGPSLRNLYKRPTLMSGDEVNDQTVMAQIRLGNARMPAYGAVLNDKDLSDLIIYLREKCCWDEMNPPTNPRYHPE